MLQRRGILLLFLFFSPLPEKCRGADVPPSLAIIQPGRPGSPKAAEGFLARLGEYLASQTKLARPMYDLHVVVPLCQLVGDLARSIWRIVVHDDDLSANAYASKDAGDGVDQFGELLALIVSGNDDREFHISKSL